jgi:hypothetical protein
MIMRINNNIDYLRNPCHLINNFNKDQDLCIKLKVHKIYFNMLIKDDHNVVGISSSLSTDYS